MPIDRTNQTQTSMWLPSELLDTLSLISGNLGVSRQKLIQMVLTEFVTGFEKAQDPETLFGKLSEQMSQDYVARMRSLVEGDDQ